MLSTNYLFFNRKHLSSNDCLTVNAVDYHQCSVYFTVTITLLQAVVTGQLAPVGLGSELVSHAFSQLRSVCVRVAFHVFGYSHVLLVDVSTSATECLERHVSERTCYLSRGTWCKLGSVTQSAELNQPIVPCSARVKLEMLQVLLHQLIQQNIIW